MRLTPGPVRLLVAQERDHRDLERYKLNQLPRSGPARFVERELRRNPWLTRAELPTT